MVKKMITSFRLNMHVFYNTQMLWVWLVAPPLFENPASRGGGRRGEGRGGGREGRGRGGEGRGKGRERGGGMEGLGYLAVHACYPPTLTSPACVWVQQIVFITMAPLQLNSFHSLLRQMTNNAWYVTSNFVRGLAY